MAGLVNSLSKLTPLQNLRVGISTSPLRTSMLGLEALLVVILAWVCAQLVWAIMTPLPSSSAPLPLGVSAPSGGFNVNLSRLRGFPYFYPVGAQERRMVSGPQEGPQRSEPRVSETAAPETDLALKLFGVRAEVGAQDRGSAIIQTTDNKQAAFVPGQMIQQGVRLEQVFPDRVEIVREGVRESLYLNPDREPVRPSPLLAGASAEVEGAFERAPSVTTAPAMGAAAVSRGELASISPAEALAQFQLRPRLEGSRINGFVVQALGADPRLRVLDVQPGDVIMDVNGTRLTSFERVSELPDELRGATELRIGLIRDGRREERRIEVTP